MCNFTTQLLEFVPVAQGPKAGELAWTFPGWDSGGALAAQRVLAMPFDVARALYAEGARVGVVCKSLRASCAFDQSLARAEQYMLGPLARRR
jgi:hypothetical protein